MPRLSEIDWKAYRTPILWCELGALLHNLGKLHPAFAKVMASGGVNGETLHPGQFNYRKIAGRTKHWPPYNNEHADADQTLTRWGKPRGAHVFDTPIGFPANCPVFGEESTICVGDLIEWHLGAPVDVRQKDGTIQTKTGWDQRGILCWLMAVAHHNASGINKRSPERDWLETKLAETNDAAERDTLKKQLKKLDDAGLKKQAWPWMGCNAFGFESPVPEDGSASITAVLEAASKKDAVTNYEAWRRTADNIIETQSQFLADSRKPIHDTRVSDIARSASAFLKAAISWWLVEGVKAEPNGVQLEWCLLRVALDGPGFVNQAVRIPDMLARRKLAGEALDALRKRLEWCVPIANEIYRDERGSVFLCANFKKEQRTEVETLLREAWEGTAVADELQWRAVWGDPFALGPEGGYSFQLGKLLEEAPPVAAGSVTKIQAAWSGVSGCEVCTVCGLRPMGTKKKERARKVCAACEKRREDRSVAWIGPASTDSNHTIWIDEAADANGRIVLFCARFRLKPWLEDGGYLEKSYFLNPDPDPSRRRSLAPSFARLQRLWAETTEFWEETLRLAEQVCGERKGRLEIRGRFLNSGGNLDELGPGHTYYLSQERGKRQLSVVSAPMENGKNGEVRLLLAENPERAFQLYVGRRAGDPQNPGTMWYLSQLQGLLRGKWEVEEPTGYGSPNRNVGALSALEGAADLEITIDENRAWYPIIEILKDPYALMFLAPAEAGADTLEKTIAHYGERMAKVRDRLGIDFGLVYAPATTPLPAVVQAGRAMLSRRGARREYAKGETGWDLPEDKFRANVETANGVWEHYAELAKGTRFRAEESTLDFEFLESAGRRFEVAYAGEPARRRVSEKAHRPIRIEDFTKVRQCWETLKASFGMAQIKALDGLLHAKRTEWGAEHLSCDFIKAAFWNADWKKGSAKDTRPQDIEFLTDCVKRGWFADALEIFLSIEKYSPREDDRGPTSEATADPGDNATRAMETLNATLS